MSVIATATHRSRLGSCEVYMNQVFNAAACRDKVHIPTSLCRFDSALAVFHVLQIVTTVENCIHGFLCCSVVIYT